MQAGLPRNILIVGIVRTDFYYRLEQVQVVKLTCCKGGCLRVFLGNLVLDRIVLFSDDLLNMFRVEPLHRPGTHNTAPVKYP